MMFPDVFLNVAFPSPPLELTNEPSPPPELPNEPAPPDVVTPET